jgi:hypothetical protein
VLLLILDIDHLLAIFAFSDVAAAICFMEIDSIDGEGFVAVAALLIFCVHFSYYSNNLLISILYLHSSLNHPKSIRWGRLKYQAGTVAQ